jgi:hypothetical protein
MRIRMNGGREQRLDRLLKAAGKDTKAKAINIAIQHYLADKRAKKQLVDELPAAILEELSTP